MWQVLLDFWHLVKTLDPRVVIARKAMKKRLLIKYGSQVTDIDANTLIVSLMSITEAIGDINSYLNSTEGMDRKINMRINGVDTGSFVLDVTIIQSLGESLMALWMSSGGVVSIVELLANIIQIVSFLRGKEPKKVDRGQEGVQITNYYNECKMISVQQLNVYMGCSKAREAIAKNNEILADDVAVTDFSISDEQQELVRYDKAAMTEAIKSPELVDSEGVRWETDEAWVTAIRLSYNSMHKWTFVYRGISITARIEDRGFWERVDNNEAFCKGDIFKVRLRIKQIRDYEAKAWFNKEYSIVEVTEHRRSGDEQIEIV